MKKTKLWLALLVAAPLVFVACGYGDRDEDEPEDESGGAGGGADNGGGGTDNSGGGTDNSGGGTDSAGGTDNVGGAPGGATGGAVEEGNLVINEFMASNDTGWTDEEGEFEDWIEIYNGTASPVDLGGYFVSDDPATPTLFQLPTGQPETVIPTGGYLILIGDKTPDAGPLHIDLKLSGSGEAFGLYDSDGNTIDEYVYEAQATDQSTGRSPSGTGGFCVMAAPTPGAENGACAE